MEDGDVRYAGRCGNTRNLAPFRVGAGIALRCGNDGGCGSGAPTNVDSVQRPVQTRLEDLSQIAVQQWENGLGFGDVYKRQK